MIDLLLASDNRGKLAELQAMLPGDVEIRTLADLGIAPAEETGATFAENSAIKAVHAAQASGLLTLADDSGLAVAALDGRPGVRSKRYAGEQATDEDNIRLLLEELSVADDNSRHAGFVCVLTLASPGGVLASATGRCEGRIGTERRGQNGFGYDPVFYIEDGRTIAELGAAEKNLISHRGRALKDMLPALLIAIGTYKMSSQGVGQ
jgi:XTP/dITP diphosphohydrolase